jgi:hypothetical protein
VSVSTDDVSTGRPARDADAGDDSPEIAADSSVWKERRREVEGEKNANIDEPEDDAVQQRPSLFPGPCVAVCPRREAQVLAVPVSDTRAYVAPSVEFSNNDSFVSPAAGLPKARRSLHLASHTVNPVSECLF